MPGYALAGLRRNPEKIQQPTRGYPGLVNLLLLRKFAAPPQSGSHARDGTSIIP